jgi:hypothetical protein
LLARTLEVLSRQHERKREMTRRKKASRENERSKGGDEPLPRDIDELRRSIARKLEEITGEPIADPDGPM